MSCVEVSLATDRENIMRRHWLKGVHKIGMLCLGWCLIVTVSSGAEGGGRKQGSSSFQTGLCDATGMSVAESDLLGCRDLQETHEIRRHAWNVLASLTKPKGFHSSKPLWRTWASACEKSLTAPRESLERSEVSLPLEFVAAFRAQYASDSDALRSAAKYLELFDVFETPQKVYNQVACQHIRSEHLMSKDALDDRLRELVQTEAPAREREIKPFPNGATVVKATWRRIGPDSGSLTEIRVWPPRGDSSKGTEDKVWVKFAPRERCNLPVSGDTPVFSSCFYSVPDPDPSAQGSWVILVGLHVMMKETQDWVWMTFWWHPLPDSGVYGADKPGETVLRAPWRNYLANVTLSQETPWELPPPIAGKPPKVKDACGQDVTVPSRAKICFNPFLELGLPNGELSNCMNCHKQAAYPLIHPDPRLWPQRGALSSDAACFDQDGNGTRVKRIQLDYMWGLVPRESDPLQQFRYALWQALLQLQAVK
jgi:hypothetical protein